jgi:hypothetical protein
VHGMMGWGHGNLVCITVGNRGFVGSVGIGGGGRGGCRIRFMSMHTYTTRLYRFWGIMVGNRRVVGSVGIGGGGKGGCRQRILSMHTYTTILYRVGGNFWG